MRQLVVGAPEHEFAATARSKSLQEEQAMRSLIFLALTGLLAGTAAAAGETAVASDRAFTVGASGGAIQVNSSFNTQVFVAVETEPQIQEQERRLKQSMYERAVGECELLRATIALSCRMTGISVSTQITSTPGNPATLYVNANVSMEVMLK
jgi:hypothetical protein